jgi:ribose transport system permease protein
MLYYCKYCVCFVILLRYFSLIPTSFLSFPGFSLFQIHHFYWFSSQNIFIGGIHFMKVGNSMKIKQVVRRILDNIVWIILISSVFGFSIFVPGFININNYINIVYHSVFIGVLAISLSFCLISGNLDLSIESVAGFMAIMSAWLCGTSFHSSGLLLDPYLALAIVLALGAIIGMINGFFIIKMKINAFLVTLSVYIIFKGLTLMVTQGQGIAKLPDSFRLIDTIHIFNIPLMVFLMIALFVVFQFILKDTLFGRHVYVIGGNPQAAYKFGVNVSGTLYRVFILSGMLAALTGWLIAARINGATPTAANGFLFETMAAVIIGGVSMTGGIGNLTGVIGGVLLLSSIHSALNIMAISPFVTDVIRGLLVLIAVVLDSLKRMLK